MGRIQTKIREATDAIEAQISCATSPIVAFSGGKDSVLLYALTNEIRAETPVIMLSAFWSRKQKQIARQILGQFPPVTQYEFRPDEFALQGHPNSDDHSLIAFYRFGSRHIPLIMDVVKAENICAGRVFESVLAMPLLKIDYLWDLTLVGTKKTDTHPLFNGMNPAELSNSGRILFDPLARWTDAEVWEAIGLLKLKTNDEFYEKGNELMDTGNFTANISCVLNKV